MCLCLCLLDSSALAYVTVVRDKKHKNVQVRRGASEQQWADWLKVPFEHACVARDMSTIRRYVGKDGPTSVAAAAAEAVVGVVVVVDVVADRYNGCLVVVPLSSASSL